MESLKRHIFYSLILISGLLVSSHVKAQGVDSLFVQGNQLYSEKKFGEALNKYQEIIAQKVFSPELYLNAGNAAYKSNQLGASILYYEKGLKLKPNDEDLLFNLDIANQKVVDKYEVVNPLSKWWVDFVNAGKTWWAILAVLFSFLSFGILIAIVLKRFHSQFLPTIFVVFSFVLFSLSLFLNYEQENLAENDIEAIVFVPRIGVKSSPDESADNLFFLHEGSKVKVRQSDSDWVEVNFSGHVGWAKKESLKKI